MVAGRIRHCVRTVAERLRKQREPDRAAEFAHGVGCLADAGARRGGDRPGMKGIERYDDPELETNEGAPLILFENAVVISAVIFLVLLAVSLLAYRVATR